MADLATTIAAPLRGIEAIAQLLQTEAVDDRAKAGELLLECVGEIRAACRVDVALAAPAAPSAAPPARVDPPGSGPLPGRTYWRQEEREAAVLAAVQLFSDFVRIREIAARVIFPPSMQNGQTRVEAVRRGLRDLIDRGLVLCERAEGSAAMAPYLYRLARVEPLGAVA